MQLASEDGFRADPPLVWRWYAWRRELVRAAHPNAGHLALAAAQSRFDSFDLITQNVDGLHVRAGSAPIELHGNLMRTICLARCGFVEHDLQRLPAGEPPRCPACGDWLRPGVVWFGEAIPPSAARDAARAAADCDVFITIGTSSIVYPAAGLLQQASRAGAFTAEINIEATEASHAVDAAIQGPAEVVLRQLDDAMPRH
jgi:NAD-dependent deacetylase